MSELHELFGFGWSDISYIVSAATGLGSFLLGFWYQSNKNKKEQELNREQEHQERAERDQEIQKRLYELQENQLDSNEKLIDATNRLYEQIGKQSASMGNRIDRVVVEVDDHETRITKLEKLKKVGI